MMKAWAQTKFGDESVLQIMEVPKPQPGPRDILIRVVATGVNPVDVKKRQGFPLGPREAPYYIVGWDGAGVVEAVGSEVTLFKAEDEVYFSGDVSRDGCNAEFVVVDERIVGRKPKNLSFREAAAEPLTVLTAWEGMVEGMHIPVPKDENDNPNGEKTILVVGGAGGVGSITIQIAKKVLKFGKVVATASREETSAYVRKMGADEVIDHTKDFKAEFERIGLPGAHYVMNTVELDNNFDAIESIILPLGAICAIIHAGKPINVGALFLKRVSLVWELMFTRPMFGVEPEKQGQILNHFAGLYESGVIEHRANKVFEWSQLPEAQRHQDTGRSIGKIVLDVKF